MYLCRMKLLDSIESPKDLRKLEQNRLADVAKDLRDFIIQAVATKEGHLGASLGVVELSLALHYYYQTPEDIIVWDVGHQAYAHKILTGRRDVFDTNRQLNGISGFPVREESPYDSFGVGHSSTSISACLGMAIAAELKKENKKHIAIIGDASIVSGMAMEALNHLGATQTDMLVILNDNQIGIDPSVGALKNAFIQAKASQERLSHFFAALGIQYFGPVDGHDIDQLLQTFKDLENHPGPKLLHVLTTKGKGLRQAEENQVVYHAPGKFDAKTGDLLPNKNNGLAPRFQDVFGWTLLELARENPKVMGITPAMPTGSSLKYMMEEFPERALDVGIAEQHAVTLAAGLATQNMKVYCTIYSTFLQRAYDQVIHDVCLQNLAVVFCIDRAGLVGEDGATHHGIFDIAYLKAIPNLVIFAARDLVQLRQILYTSQFIDQPIAIRYPRGRGFTKDWKLKFEKIPIGKAEQLKTGSKIALIGAGPLLHQALEAIENTGQADKIACYDLRFIKPLDEAYLHEIFKQYEEIICIEDGVIAGGLGESILNFAMQHQYKQKVHLMGITDEFPTHARVEELYEIHGLDKKAIKEKLLSILNR